MPRRDDDEHVGYPMNHLFRRRNGDADELMDASEASPSDSEATPVDLAAVQADDALLDSLGRADAARGDTDAELARVLLAWRREVDTESIGQLVDVDTATATINAARRPASRRHPMLAPVAVAAAALVIAFSGVGLVAKSAQPGDQLFSLTKVLYADYARSVEAKQRVETELAEAKTAFDEGKTSQAKESLELARKQLPVIADSEGRAKLATEHQKLEQMLNETTIPAEPDSTTEPSTSQTSVQPSAEPVSPSAPATTTTTLPPTREPDPPSTSASTQPSPSGPAGPEQGTAETRPGEAGPRADEGSSSSVTAPNG